MKDYYTILGVPRTAHAAEIKRAYRRLVQQFHPDINPDPSAQELIKEINEAYDVLGDEVKRREYDFRLTNPFTSVVVEEPVRHRDPAYHRRASHPSAPPQGPTQMDMMKGAMPYLKIMARVSCTLCLFLLIDFVLPRKKKLETISKVRTEVFRRNTHLYFVTNTGRDLNFSTDDLYKLRVGDNLVFEETFLLEELVDIQNAENTLHINNLATLYGNFVFVPMVLLICSMLVLLPYAKLDLRFNAGIVTAFMLIFTVILML